MKPKNVDAQRTVVVGLTRSLKVTLAILFGLLAVVLYLHTVQMQSLVNDDKERTDQGQYMNFVVKVHKSGFHYTGGRNRMPLYPFWQTLFYSPDMTDTDFFEQGKRLNVVLSLLGLALIAAAFYRRFSKLFATYAVLEIAFLVFAFKAPYFQTEILFYTIFGFAYIVAVDALSAPTLPKLAGVGLLFALAHLSKASAFAGLILFLFSYCVFISVSVLARSSARRSLLTHVSFALTPLIVFIIVLSPYLLESKQRYGTWFYNVNTTFYIWYDSWDEALAGTRAAGDRQGWPDLPDDQIPGLHKYLEEHTPDQILDRFRSGIERLVSFGCWRKWSKHRFGYCSQIGLNLIVLAVCAGILLATCPIRRIHRRVHIGMFMVLFLCGYGLVYAWYMPLIGNGNRTILSLMIPFLWTVGMVVHAPRVAALRMARLPRRPRAIFIVYALMLISLFYEIYQVLNFRALTMYGGE